MLQRIKHSYYAKIMIVCISAVLAISMLLLPLCSRLIRMQQQNEYLKNYDLALSALSGSIYSKYSTLASGLAPLFSDEDKYQTLLRLYRHHSKKTPPGYNSDVVSILSTLCSGDSNCQGALLLTRTGHLFQYNIRHGSLQPLTLKYASKPLTPYQVQVLTDVQIENLSNDLQKPAARLYGFCVSVFDPDSDSMEYLGTLILLYSAAEFSAIIDGAGVDDESVFSILDKDLNVIFSSDGTYDSSKKLLVNTDSPQLTSSSREAAVLSELDGNSYYTSTLYSERYQVYTTYQLPSDAISHTYIQVILAVLSIAICLAAIFLYFLAFWTSDRKIRSIQKGMERVGENNLTYRLPMTRGKDEFSQIIQSFNSMCDALQRNVEKAYLYEISQRKAELYAMQTSINPHFLYNALEQIRVHILSGHSTDASRMLLLLSKMYRNQTRRNLYISIAEECSQSENLINFYMYRYGDFEYEFHVHSSIKKYGLPKNTLQPLIENFFVHGYIPDSDENFLCISISPVQQENGLFIRFSIEDNGASISEEDLEALKEKLSQPVMSRQENNGFALSNVNQRLKLVFGENAALTPGIGTDGVGFCITFLIPARLPEELSEPQ